MPLSEYDADRLTGLTRTRRRATGLLVLATLVFAATFFMGDATWVGFLRSTAEASMIGGLADWFAVVALFRHPLGIPIPHTAVIPKSKEGLGHSLGEFIRNNFLAPDHIVERLEAARVSEKLGTWLADPTNSDVAAGHIATTLGAIVEGLDSKEIEDELERMVVERLRALPMAEMVGRGMEAAIAGGQHRPMLTAAIRGIATSMDDNRTALRRRLGDESPWWVPEAVDDAVFDRAYLALKRFLGELAADADHEVRRTIDARLSDLSVRLRTDPDLAKLVSDRVDDLAGHPELRAWARGTWSELATALIDASGRPDSRLRARLGSALQGFGARLAADASMQNRIETWIRSLAPPLAAAGQREIGDLIATTVDRWDPVDTSRRLELWLGRDLQFVRINGTVVGALAGLLIHTVVHLSGAA